MKELFRLTLAAARKKIAAGEITSRQLVESCLKRIEATDKQLKAWVCRDAGIALKQADAIDQARAEGKTLGALAGVPIGVKDIFNTSDFPTCMGSPLWQGFTPGNDARVVYYIRQEGGVIPGKTTTAEFAVHAPADTVNPHSAAHSPGTSSSGSAVAVAAFHVPAALGTQTAGSIIRPASYCGVYGFKPTFGTVPRTGALKTTDSLDTIGMFARSVEDLQIFFDVIRVHGENFPLLHRFLENPDYQNKPAGEPWRILVVTDSIWTWQHADDYAKKALLDLAAELGQENGYSMDTAALPQIFGEAHRIHQTIYDKTLAYYFKEEFKKHTLISPIMYEIINRGNLITKEQYEQAVEEQNHLRHTAEALLERYDAVLTLSTSGQAPLFGKDDKPDTALIWTLCGLPVINLPLFRSPSDLPFGIQIAGKRFRDYRLLKLASQLESRFNMTVTQEPALTAAR